MQSNSNVDVLKIETIKTIDHLIKLMKNTKTLDSEAGVLENEKLKIIHNDFIVAIVGTVKSGKSTSINAITGQEIMPNRNSAMTTIPTLVTHTIGEKIPKLKLSNIDPIIELINNVKVELSKNEYNCILFDIKDQKQFLNAINQKDLFAKEYIDKDEIFDFLKFLNDLMRVAKDLNIKPPYDYFVNIADLPRVEVEFYFLQNKQNAQNVRLSLLDTPGPNEYKQNDYLEQVFNDQVKRASVVMLILDYPSISSVSSGKILEEVAEVEKLIGKDNIFILANKYDQKTSKDASYEDAKKEIANKLDNKIDLEHIFLVSARDAFFANLGLKEIAENGKISASLPWASDFGNIILGEFWEEDINDNARVIKYCEKKWEKSNFDEPLEKVITHGYNNSAIQLIRSVIHKLNLTSRVTKNILNTKLTSLQKDMSELNNDIKSLHENVEKLTHVKENLKATINSELKYIKIDIDNGIKSKLLSTRNGMNAFFTGSTDAEEGTDRGVFLNEFLKLNSKNELLLNNFIDRGELSFSSKEQANEFLNILQKMFKNSIKDIYIESENSLKQKLQFNLIPKINDSISMMLGDLIDTIKSKVSKEINIDIPEISLNKDGTLSCSIGMNSVQEKGITKNERVEKSYIGAGIVKFIRNLLPIGDSWIYENKEISDSSYIINRDNILKNINSEFDKISIFIKNNTDFIYASDVKEIVLDSIDEITKEVEDLTKEMEMAEWDKRKSSHDITEEIETTKKSAITLKELEQRIKIITSYLQKLFPQLEETK